MRHTQPYIVLSVLVVMTVLVVYQDHTNTQTQPYKGDGGFTAIRIIDQIHDRSVLQEYINMDNDASLYVFVSADKPLRNRAYIPAQLVTIDSPYIIQRSPGMQLRPEANAAFHDLAQAFYQTFEKKLYLVSAYRSYRSQQHLIDSGCPPSRCAQPGTSEHQLGLAIDIHVGINGRQTNSMADKNSIYYRRLEQNAHKFGWHNTFQKGIHVDGQMEEGRHRRYLGGRLATYLWSQDITIAEYYQRYRVQKQ